MKDLYERLITDYNESTNAETNKTENCESTNNDIKGHIYVDTDSVKVAPLPEQQTGEESIIDTIIADDNIGWFDSKSEETFGYEESRRYKVTLR